MAPLVGELFAVDGGAPASGFISKNNIHKHDLAGFGWISGMANPGWGVSL